MYIYIPGSIYQISVTTRDDYIISVAGSENPAEDKPAGLPFNQSFINSFTHRFIHSLIDSFILSLIHSLTKSLLTNMSVAGSENPAEDEAAGLPFM